ncbi:hypothetical protein HJFPF1_05464 [Paramyrothecium foliicola]|nr:hypothetical protein HJFPF1_05464 [Paramyrothecium foliicola]
MQFPYEVSEGERNPRYVSAALARVEELSRARYADSPRARFFQPESPLFQKATPEIRHAIYDLVLSSTRLTWGKKDVSENSIIEYKPAHHSLAILQVCQKLRREIGESWKSKILFDFVDQEKMLHKLTAMTTDLRSKIRHVRVKDVKLPVEMGSEHRAYSLPYTLTLLPDLQLDQLTVLGSAEPMDNYKSLELLIAHSNGWKKLRYIVPSSKMLALPQKGSFWDDPKPRMDYNRNPQPAH